MMAKTPRGSNVIPESLVFSSTSDGLEMCEVNGSFASTSDTRVLMITVGKSHCGMTTHFQIIAGSKKKRKEWDNFYIAGARLQPPLREHSTSAAGS